MPVSAQAVFAAVVPNRPSAGSEVSRGSRLSRRRSRFAYIRRGVRKACPACGVPLAVGTIRVGIVVAAEISEAYPRMGWTSRPPCAGGAMSQRNDS